MGEIKSTLDLVMEKTKHMSLSTEEKVQQESAEIEKMVNGLLQKTSDGVIEINELYRSLDDLKMPDGQTLVSTLLPIIIARIDLEQDNSDLLAILAGYCRSDTTALEKVLSAYNLERRQAAAAHVAAATQKLAEKYTISGSAVVPNLRTDKSWKERLSSIKRGFQKDLQKETQQLKAAVKEKRLRK